MTKKLIEGSVAIAEAVTQCKPKVISAYPITPQTHIVQELAQIIADGKLKASFINVESEFSAASVVQGASARGVRVYSSTASQGLLLMLEVMYCIAGNRLPVCMTVANRAVSSPLSIWNDHQDSITARDSGWLQYYAETNQEAVDFQIQAFRISEDHRVLLPSIVCIDGYILSHGYEPVDIPEQEAVEAFLPSYKPLYRLDPAKPLAFGSMAEPRFYQETRLALSNALKKSISVIEEVAADFERVFGRPGIQLVEKYRMKGAETVIIAMGSVCGTIKNAIDEMRENGERVGLLRIIVYRPFPEDVIINALKGVKNVIILDRSVVLGVGGPVALEIKSSFCNVPDPKPIFSDVIGGLGGRDITQDTVKRLLRRAGKEQFSFEWVDVNPDVVIEEYT